MRLSSSGEKRSNNGLNEKAWTRVGWVGGLLVVFGYYLNANMYVCSWLAWIIGNSMMGGYCLRVKAYPTAVMSFILVLMNIYGFISWLDK